MCFLFLLIFSIVLKYTTTSVSKITGYDITKLDIMFSRRNSPLHTVNLILSELERFVLHV